jgi:DMSO reductase anchor subunit
VSAGAVLLRSIAGLIAFFVLARLFATMIDGWFPRAHNGAAAAVILAGLIALAAVLLLARPLRRMRTFRRK